MQVFTCFIFLDSIVLCAMDDIERNRKTSPGKAMATERTRDKPKEVVHNPPGSVTDATRYVCVVGDVLKSSSRTNLQ